MQSFLFHYRLVAVALLAVMDGDVTLVMAGVVAHFRLFSLPAGIAVGSAGAFTGDTLFYAIGRTNTRWIQNTRLYRRMGSRAENLLHRFGVGQLFAMRLVYGTRIATLVLCGVRGIAFWRFALFDILSCMAWATLLGLLGFALSDSATWLISAVKRVEIAAAATLIVTLLAIVVVRRVCAQRM